MPTTTYPLGDRLRYRPDIDGLRAAAVVPVVLYHLGFKIAPGGYVGVDIFFVISGYLITQMISAELATGTYSVANFYVRRARRIFPASFFMCATLVVFAVFNYLPSEVKAFQHSLTASILFVSNIYFLCTENYFAPVAAPPPLLHMWSLAVEEQFYIFFPIILSILRRYLAKREVMILVGLAVASLVTSTWLVWVNPSAAFYLLPSRAWELLIGSLLAIGVLPALRIPAVSECLAVIGMVLIAASVALYSSSTPFPGLMALSPCIGAALVIYSGAHYSPTVSRLLAFRPIRFIGLISYSLYLWHWPLIVIARFYIGPLNGIQNLGILIASFVAAVLSWQFVEKPFRRKPFLASATKTLTSAAAAMIALIVLGAAIYPLSIKRWNIPDGVQRILALLDYDATAPMRVGSCFLTTGYNDFSLFDKSTCLHLSVEKRNVLLIGDSHAADLWAGLAQVSTDANVLQATASGCKPLLNSKGEHRCTTLMKFVLGEFLPRHHIDTIVLSGRWQTGDLENVLLTAQALKAFADRVIVFGPTVEYRHPLPRIVAMGMIRNDPSIVERDRLGEIRRMDELYADRLRHANIEYFSVYQAICPHEQCQLTGDDGTLLEFDYGHFTLSGSIYVAERARQSGML
jgi:peptidoglycan/LPS O-acetylase OafA/YrhL